MDDRKPPTDEEHEGSRRATDVGLLVAAVIIIGAAFWLVNALVDANKRELCLESGRHAHQRAGPADRLNGALRRRPQWPRAGSGDHQIW